MIASVTFAGVVKGKEKTFAKGDTITKAESEEMNLKAKPNLVEKEAKQDAET